MLGPPEDMNLSALSCYRALMIFAPKHVFITFVIYQMDIASLESAIGKVDGNKALPLPQEPNVVTITARYLKHRKR